MTYSLRVLDIFTTELMPEMSAFRDEYNQRVDLAVKTLTQQIEACGLMEDMASKHIDATQLDDDVKIQILRDVQRSIRCVNIFHRLAHLSLYVEHQLVVADIVYQGIGTQLLSFMDEHYDFFSTVLMKDNCFDVLDALYHDWRHRKLIESKQEDCI